MLAEAWEESIHPSLLNVLADDVRAPTIYVRHVYRDNGDNVKVVHESSIQPAVGLQTGPSLPSNMAILVGLGQSGFPRKTKGRFFLPGIPEGKTDRNVLLAAFKTTEVSAFVDALSAPISSLSNGGEYTLLVRSQKAWYAPIQTWIDGGKVGPRPEPDWAGGTTPATSASVKPAISHQSRRGTKVRGAAGA